MEVDIDEFNYPTHTSNPEKTSLDNPKLSNIGDGKCYFPCMKWKGIKRRRINKSTTIKHCLEYGNLEGGIEYYPLVS